MVPEDMDPTDFPPMPDIPVIVTVPSEITLLQEHYEDSEGGRVRNARIALVAVLVALLLVAACAVALAGWFATSRALEQRNDAVHDLTEQSVEVNRVLNRQAAVDICQDQALAAWLDSALGSGELESGVLSRYYAKCEATDGERFR